MNKKASLSIVVPCHNEEEVLPATYGKLKEVADHLKKGGIISKYELLFVNNGSTDGTLTAATNFYKKDKNVVITDLRKNYGFQGSISAGLFSAKGDMVVTIDADLQDDPLAIEEMVKKYYEGFPMVLGVRDNRDSDSFLKRTSAQAYYCLLKYLGISCVYNHADFRLLGRDVVNALRALPERVRFLRSLIFEVESRYAVVYYKRTPRKLGKSKFNVLQLISLGIDGITSFSGAPIRLFSFIGFLMFFMAIAGLVYVLTVRYFWGVEAPGWAFLSIIIFFFGGMQSLFLGVFGEYILKLFLEAKQRPLYIIRKEYRHDALN